VNAPLACVTGRPYGERVSTSFSDLYVVSSGRASYSHSDQSAYELSQCPQCGGTQMAVIAYRPGVNDPRWLRCVNCGLGLVENKGVAAPGVKPLSTPQGVEAREREVWEEARSCLAVGANAAAVMLCRNLLLHVAIGNGLSPEDDKGRSPNFDVAVNHLQSVGVITVRMKPWVDRIREVGNQANHKLEAISAEQALDVARFTEQLLRLAYEMDSLMREADPSAGDRVVKPDR